MKEQQLFAHTYTHTHTHNVCFVTTAANIKWSVNIQK